MSKLLLEPILALVLAPFHSLMRSPSGPAVAEATRAPVTFHSVTQPLSSHARAEVKRAVWHPGCPVALSDLRVLTVSYFGVDHKPHTGQLVVNNAAPPR